MRDFGIDCALGRCCGVTPEGPFQDTRAHTLIRLRNESDDSGKSSLENANLQKSG